MTPESMRLIRQSWSQVSSRRDLAAVIFYGRLFELDPGLLSLFEHKDFLGEVIVLGNNQSLSHLGTLNDRVSSISVAQQCLLVAYADAEYAGATTAFRPACQHA